MPYLPMEGWATDDLRGAACPRAPTEGDVRALICVPDRGARVTPLKVLIELGAVSYTHLTLPTKA